MFEYHQNTLCVAANWLYKDNQIMTISNYCRMLGNPLKRATPRGGNGRTVWITFESIPDRFKKAIREKGIDPYASVKKIVFAEYMQWDHNAEDYFKSYILDNGTHLPEEKQQEYTHQAIMFNTVQHIATNVVVQKRFGGKKEMWERMLQAIQNLPETWLHTRYKNVISFKRAFKKYEDEGYSSIVSGKWMNTNSSKIVDEVADWILSQYCLPIKYTISEVFQLYNSIREDKGWKSITERAIGEWLDKTEQKRIWMALRDGKEEYMKHFGHTITRNRSKWFPNAWWAIDGSKLDLVHYADNKLKMAAELKINYLFDVHSEYLIGYDVCFTENHASHFRTLKMGVNHAGCRPHLFTYDNQSGHKSERMQQLYNRLPAKGGTHYPHKSGRKGSPAEQIINRFQQEEISKLWQSDKQGIKVRTNTNKPNVDFIVEFKEGLPTIDEVQKIVQACVNHWNSGKQKNWTMTRTERYNQETEHREEISTMDQLAMFWIDETKPKKYYAHGLPLTVEGQDYLYEVYNPDGTVDLEFRRKWVQEKLIVRYDPEYLNDYVALYELTASREKRFVAYAEKKRAHETIPIHKRETSKALLDQDIAIKEMEWKRDYEAGLAVSKRSNITRETMIEKQELFVKFQGHLPKEEQMATDSNAFQTRFTKY